MALPKRAKKFRQKHLSGKIEQHKREKKHAQLVQKRKRGAGKRGGVSEPEKPGVDLDVPTSLADFISSDEGSGDEGSGGSGDESDAEAAELEAEYLDDAVDETSTELPDVIDKKVIAGWRRSLEKSPVALGAVVRAMDSENVGRLRDRASVDSLKALLLEAPATIARFYPSAQSAAPLRATLKALAALLAALLGDTGSAEGAEQELVALADCCAALLPYLVVCNREMRTLARALAAVVARADRDDAAKLRAFDALRKAPERPEIAKIAYAAFVKSAAKTNAFNAEALNLTKSLFATLFLPVESDSESGEAGEGESGDGEAKTGEGEAKSVTTELYQTAFQQIRQLALHLKTALDKAKHPTYDLDVVYTSQFVQSLDFWSRVLSQHDYLAPLIHPYCQVALRVISLVPNALYLPLRFFVARALVRLARHTGVYIPLAPPVVDAVLRGCAVLSKPAGAANNDSAAVQIDFDAVLHVPQGYLGSRVFQNAVLDEFCDLLAECLVLYAKSIAFPELCAPIVVALKRFAKHEAPLTRNPRIRQQLQTLCDRLESNAKFVLQKRSNVKFGPRDQKLVNEFLADLPWEDTPLGKEAIARRRVRTEKKRLASVTETEA